jgi:superfamily II DNA or RNA helicase
MAKLQTSVLMYMESTTNTLKPKMLFTASELEQAGFKAATTPLLESEIFKQHLRRITQLFTLAKRKNPHLQARDYQLESAAMYCCRPNNLAALSQGLGKTLIATLIAANLYSRTDRAGTIHICIPNATMLPRWLEDLSLLFAPQEITYLSNSDLGRMQLTRKNNLIKRTKVLIYTHDFARYAGKTGHNNGRYLLESAPPSFLVIDEIHHFKDADSLKYKALDPIARKAKRVLGLSGTLSEGNLSALSNILQLVYQRDWIYFRQTNKLHSLFGQSLDLGLNYTTGERSASKANKILSSVNSDKLSEFYNLARIYVHRLSIDQPEIRSQIQLPTAKFTAYAVDFNFSQKSAYDQALIPYSQDLISLNQNQSLSQSGTTYAQSLLHEAIKICNSGVDGLATPKSQMTVNLTAAAKKTVIFCQHVSSARFIYNQLVERWGKSAVVRIYSKDEDFDPATQNTARRWAAIEQFEQDPKIKAGVFSLNLASEAIDLVAADRVIIYCAPWSGAKFDQCLRRTLRPGNKHPVVDIITIYHKRAIDKYQLQLIEAKQKIGRLLLDYSDQPELENNRQAVKTAVAIAADLAVGSAAS